MPVEDPAAAEIRRAAIVYHVQRFREGRITAAELDLGLFNLLPGPLPQEHPAMAAVRQEVVRAHIDMFRRRLIPLQELYTYLLADGLPEPLARSTALGQALKRIDTPPLDPEAVTYLEDQEEVRHFARS